MDMYLKDENKTPKATALDAQNDKTSHPHGHPTHKSSIPS